MFDDDLWDKPGVQEAVEETNMQLLDQAHIMQEVLENELFVFQSMEGLCEVSMTGAGTIVNLEIDPEESAKHSVEELSAVTQQTISDAQAYIAFEISKRVQMLSVNTTQELYKELDTVLSEGYK